MFNYLFFVLIYLIVCNWIQLYYLLGNVLKPHHKLTTVDGKGILSKLNKKTKLNLTIKTIAEKKKAIGFMVTSPPFKPVMLFSERLYNVLNPSEFEWVALHESGHYLMWHNVKFAFSQVGIGIVGLFFVYYFKMTSFMFAFLFSVILAVFYIQFVRIFEYQADYYAVTHMDNPKGMITANIKMKKINKTLDGNKTLLRFFVIAVPYEVRIKMAKRQLKLNE